MSIWRHAIVRQTDGQWVAAFVCQILWKSGTHAIVYRHDLDDPFDMYPSKVAARFVVLAEWASERRSDYLASAFSRSLFADQIRDHT